MLYRTCDKQNRLSSARRFFYESFHTHVIVAHIRTCQAYMSHCYPGLVKGEAIGTVRTDITSSRTGGQTMSSAAPEMANARGCFEAGEEKIDVALEH